MKIVVGLGNFGDRYAYTYHNLGFLAAECLADRLKLSFKKRECDSLVAKGYFGGQPVIVAKPLTFMNLSGSAVAQLLAKNKAEPSDLIVVYDDIDLDKGAVRFREKGSAGTHNGMRDIIARLGSGEFCRVRIGAGRPPENVPLADYVLSNIAVAEREVFAAAIQSATDLLEQFVKVGTEVKIKA